MNCDCIFEPPSIEPLVFEVDVGIVPARHNVVTVGHVGRRKAGGKIISAFAMQTTSMSSKECVLRPCRRWFRVVITPAASVRLDDDFNDVRSIFSPWSPTVQQAPPGFRQA